jgi:hypothetical protein
MCESGAGSGAGGGGEGNSGVAGHYLFVLGVACEKLA